MTSQTLYVLSDKVGTFARECKDCHKQLFDYHLVRYKYFVDDSSAKFDCMFARRSEELVSEDQELDKIEHTLLDLTSKLGVLLGEVRHARRNNVK